jgi:hypothetical protein
MNKERRSDMIPIIYNNSPWVGRILMWLSLFVMVTIMLVVLFIVMGPIILILLLGSIIVAICYIAKLISENRISHHMIDKDMNPRQFHKDNNKFRSINRSEVEIHHFDGEHIFKRGYNEEFRKKPSNNRPKRDRSGK